MIVKTKEYNVLDVVDVEELVSQMVGRDVSIGEMEISIVDYVPLSAQDEGGDVSQTGLSCEVWLNGEEVYDEDYMGPLAERISSEAYLSEEYIFNFSTDLFKSFTRYTDSSD